jgi:hypothetical protein
MTFIGLGDHLEYIRAGFVGDSTYVASQSPVVTQTVVVPPIAPSDPTLPQVSAAIAGTPGANGWYVSSVAVTLTATGGSSTISYQIDNGPWTTYGAPFPIGEGMHVLVYQASDANGHHEPPKSQLFQVDATAPEIRPNSGSLVLSRDAPLEWTGSDALSKIAGYDVSLDGSAFRPIGLEPRIEGPWTEGPHTAIVKAFDGAGNAAAITISFRVEASAPAAPVTPAPGLAPAVPQGILSTAFVLLSLIGVLKVAVGALLHRLNLADRPKAKAPRRIARPPSKPRRTVAPVESEADLEYSL